MKVMERENGEHVVCICILKQRGIDLLASVELYVDDVDAFRINEHAQEFCIPVVIERDVTTFA